jgi:ribonucleotide monophosphatase NagD (HAD superfamily)
LDAADLFVLASAQSETLTLDDYAGILFPGTERKIPCLCINPDFEKLVGGGQLLVQPQLRGFTLVWEGRCNGLVSPTGRFMNKACKQWSDIAPERILCIGDSPPHDIAGGSSGI